MTIVFYDYSRAPNPRRARMALVEKNVDHETVTIDLAEREQMSDAYRAINPRCTIPALKLEDGTVLCDNHGILAYLEAAYPEPPLLGRTPVEKADVASWHARIEFEGLMSVAEALRNSSPFMKDRAITGPVNYAQIPELAERGLARIDQFYDMFNDHLAGREYIVGDHFTVADIIAVCTVDFAAIVKKRPGEAHPEILRWRSALDARPSVKA